MRRLPTRDAVGLAILGVVIHLIAVPVLLMLLVSAAYWYADTVAGGGVVDSWDRMYKLGDSPYLAAVGLVLLGFADVAVTGWMVIVPQTRPWAWWSPAVALAISVLVVVVAILTFQQPPPDLGG